MLKMIVTGRLGQDMQVREGTKSKFMSFQISPLGTDNIWVEVTQNIKIEPPKHLMEGLKSGSTVSVIGYPYPKIKKSGDKEEPSLAMFADEIEIVARKKA